MLKKSLLFLAVLAWISPALYAVDYPTVNGDVHWEFSGDDNHDSERKAEASKWPAAYLEQEVCRIPVKLEVGFWIKVVNCKDLKIKLTQDSIHNYHGSVDVQFVTNINLAVSAEWVQTIGASMEKDYLTLSKSTVDAPGETIQVTLGLKKVDLGGTGMNAGTCVEVGYVSIKVKPNFAPILKSFAC
jgi:hypothetical protein